MHATSIHMTDLLRKQYGNEGEKREKRDSVSLPLENRMRWGVGCCIYYHMAHTNKTICMHSQFYHTRSFLTPPLSFTHTHDRTHSLFFTRTHAHSLFSHKTIRTHTQLIMHAKNVYEVSKTVRPLLHFLAFAI